MYAVLDIGSNTIRMVLYNDNDEAYPTSVMTDRVSCGLASYIDKGVMNDEGVAVLIRTLKKYKEVVENIGVKKTFPFATASLRNLNNKEAIIHKVFDQTGFDIDVISAKDEARYDYYSIINESKEHKGVLADIGGGSTEVALFTNKGMEVSETAPIGSLNLYRDCIKDITPTKEEIEIIREKCRSEISNLGFNKKQFADVDKMYLVGGSVRAICNVLNKLKKRPYGNNNISKKDVDYLFEVYNNKRMVFCNAVLKTRADRIHTIIPGLCVQQIVMEEIGIDNAIISTSGVRDGYFSARMRYEKNEREA